MTRRKFLAYLGRFAVLFALVGQALAMLRSIVPNVVYEPPKKFKIGYPDDFSEGITFLSKYRLFVIREGNTFWTISAICTHLGCTVNLVTFPKPKKVKIGKKEFTELWEFHCPCHGSKFYGEGTPFAGPAPRPLPYYPLDLAPDGQLVVDTSREVKSDFRFVLNV